LSGTSLWYEKGIRFRCKKCGSCCRDRGEESYVFLYEGEAERMARSLSMSVEAFAASYLVDVDGFICLANFEEDCIFFDPDKGCRVYRARPLQCRAWPFWRENLRKWAWRCEVEETCPGVGKGKLYSLEMINEILGRLRTAKILRVMPTAR
jgi:Fe-S-cluster containining protein